MALGVSTSTDDRWHASTAQLAASPADQTPPADQQESVLPAGVFRLAPLPGSGDQQPAESADVQSLPDLPMSIYDSVRDDTPYRRQEQQAWFQSLAAIASIPMASLRGMAPVSVGFRELSQQSGIYRGRLVQLRGTVHRIHRLQPPPNEFGIEFYWQCWLQPAEANDPVVVYTPELPADLTEGMDLSYDVEVLGIFFKRWAYPAASGIRTAPLVLGRVSSTPHFTTADRIITESKPHGPPDQSIAGSPDVAVMGDDRPAALADYWRLLGFDQTWWQQFRDGYDVSDGERTAIRKLTDELTRIPMSTLQRDQRPELPDEDWRDRSADLRGTTFHIAGRLQSFEMMDENCYRSTIKLDGPDATVELFTSRLPRALQSSTFAPADDLDAPVGERVTATGVYLKVLGDTPGSPDGVIPRLTFALAAPRIAWHPDRVDLPANILPDKVFLADLGFDVASLDEVTSRSELASADRESFYQLLATMGRTNRAALAQVIGERVPVSQLLRHEEQHRGRLCEFVGSARSVTRVVVEDPDIRFRFGIKHYYEIVVFVDPDVTIQFVGSGPEPKEFATYPIVFCCRQIPQQLPIGQGMQVLVRTRGAFLKNWAYPSRYVTGRVTGNQPLQMQLSPLLIGYSPEILPTPPMQVPALDRLVMVLFFVGLTGMVALVWWFGRKDRRAAIRRRAGSLPERIETPEPEPQ